MVLINGIVKMGMRAQNKYKTCNLKLRKKNYSGRNNLICGKEKSYIDNILDDKTALGLPFSTNIQELSKQYKKLIIRFHPDKCDHDIANEIFIKIRERYENLTSKKSETVISLQSSLRPTPTEAITGLSLFAASIPVNALLLPATVTYITFPL